MTIELSMDTQYKIVSSIEMFLPPSYRVNIIAILNDYYVKLGQDEGSIENIGQRLLQYVKMNKSKHNF